MILRWLTLRAREGRVAPLVHTGTAPFRFWATMRWAGRHPPGGDLPEPPRTQAPFTQSARPQSGGGAYDVTHSRPLSASGDPPPVRPEHGRRVGRRVHRQHAA